MKSTCIIDTYNHDRFVCEAVESALAQSVAFDEILVVDDASTDQSQSILVERFGDDERVRLIFRSCNGGQLACIETGVLNASGDVCCFLDGDDQLDESYLRKVLQHYQENPTSQSAYVTCNAFDRSVRRTFARTGTKSTGISVGITFRGNTLIGAPTSCLSFRADLLREMFPYPMVSDWVIRADDYLNGVSSMLGVQKTFIDQELVQFRWHDRNNSWTCTQRLATYRRRLSLNRLRRYYETYLRFDASSLDSELHREFATWRDPSWKLFCWYLRTILRGRHSIPRKLAQAASLLQHQLITHWQSTPDDSASLHYCKPLTPAATVVNHSHSRCGVSVDTGAALDSRD